MSILSGPLRGKVLRWSFTIFYAGFLYLLSSRNVTGSLSFPHADKFIHVALYIPLGFLLIWALRLTSWRCRRGLPLFAIFLGVLYGISDEIHQFFVPWRESSFGDILADAFGVFIGVSVGVFIVRRLRKERVTLC